MNIMEDTTVHAFAVNSDANVPWGSQAGLPELRENLRTDLEVFCGDSVMELLTKNNKNRNIRILYETNEFSFAQRLLVLVMV